MYEHLVENCMGIVKEDLQLPFHVLERLEHPELHERSFPNYILFRHMYATHINYHLECFLLSFYNLCVKMKIILLKVHLGSCI